MNSLLRPLVTIILSRSVMFTYLESWRFGPAFIRAGKIQFFFFFFFFFFDTQNSLLIKAASGKCWGPFDFLFLVTLRTVRGLLIMYFGCAPYANLENLSNKISEIWLVHDF